MLQDPAPYCLRFITARSCINMIDILLKEIAQVLNDSARLRNLDLQIKCTVGDITMHDKANEVGGEEDMVQSIILSLVSIEEENAMKNNYPQRQIGSGFVKEKSAVYVNVFLLFTAKYGIYDTALKAISFVIGAFQTNRKVVFTVEGEDQEAVLNLHNLGFENLNNLWTVLGGRYL